MARYIRVTAIKQTQFPSDGQYTVGKEYELCSPIGRFACEIGSIIDDNGNSLNIYINDPKIKWEFVPS